MSDFGAVSAFGNFGKVDGGAGGLEIRGLRDEDGGAGNAIRIRGFLNEAANTTHNGSGLAIVDIAASVTDGGTGAQAPAANSNLVSISSHNTKAAITTTTPIALRTITRQRLAWGRSMRRSIAAPDWVICVMPTP